MKTKFITLVFAMMFLLSLTIVSAGSYDEAKIDTPVYYSFTSNNATQCNLTTGNTPSGLVEINQIATKNGQTFNVTVDKTYVDELGKHCFNLVCTDGTTIETGDFCRQVTPNGYLDSVGYYFLILILSLGLVLIGILLRDGPITILGSFGLYFLGIYILRFGIVGVMDPVFTWATAIIVLALAFYVSVKSAYELIVD